MRVKDETKKEAIFEATISLLNEIGFANLSMSEIAKKAGVSPSTIYVYFENKTDMLKKVYLNVKGKMNIALSRNIDQPVPVRQLIEQIIRNTLDFAMKQTSYFLFIEQFSNDPLLDDSCRTESFSVMNPIFGIFHRGQQEGILKNGDLINLLAFCYYGTTQIAKDKLKRNEIFSRSEIKELTQMCWDAIKK